MSAVPGPDTFAGDHTYLSTACYHARIDERPELHGYCQGREGIGGRKIPGRCKFCPAPCQCACHDAETGPAR